MLDWDRSHDWILHLFRVEETRVTIRFRYNPPSVPELAALRRCLPEFRHVAPARLRARLSETGALELGNMPTREARPLIESALGEGLDVAVECEPRVGYVPFDRTTGCAWLIEDDGEGLAVAQDMIASGIPVQEVYA